MKSKLINKGKERDNVKKKMTPPFLNYSRSQDERKEKKAWVESGGISPDLLWPEAMGRQLRVLGRRPLYHP